MNFRKMFVCHCYELDNLTWGKNLVFMEHAEFKDVIVGISLVVSSYMEIYLFIANAKACTSVILSLHFSLL